MSESSFRLPLIALRGLVAFPNAATTLDAGREKSINAVERASEGDRRILLVAQRDANVENPHQADLYQVGTLARIKQVMRLPDGAVRLFVEGQERVILTSILDAGDVLFGEAFSVPVVREDLTDLESAAYMRQIRARALRLIRISGNPGQAELINLIKGEKDPVVLTDIVAANLIGEVADKQSVLECAAAKMRLETTLELLAQEQELQRLDGKIAAKVRESMDKANHDYYLRSRSTPFRRNWARARTRTLPS